MQTDLVSLARGVHLPAALADDLRTRCRLVLDACSDDAVISNSTAARLHGFWLPDSVCEVHVATATPGRASASMTRTRLRGPVRSHRRLLSTNARTVVDGIPVTSPAQTWVDLGAELELPDLVAAGDSALRAGVSIADLREALERSRRHRGVRLATTALPLLDARSRSRPESHLRIAASDPRLPAFAVNEPVYRDEGGWLAEPDLSLAPAKSALEYQGADHAELMRMRRDITRGTDLRRCNWVMLLYGPAEVFGRPWEIAPEIIRLVRSRAPHALRPTR